MKNPKQKGSRRERQVKVLLEQEGWYVTKAGGSLGCADLVCLRLGDQPKMVQVKATEGNPYKCFGPAERKELRITAASAGATAVLCHWPSRSDPTWLYVEDWPSSKN